MYDVHEAGAGEPLLLLHSGFCTWVEFRRLIDHLATDRRVIAPTLPGSTGGPTLDVRRSMLGQHASYVEEVLDQTGCTGPVDVVGSSFGGVCALELCARGRTRSVTALAPPWVVGSGLAFYGVLFAGLPLLRFSRPMWPRSTQSDLLNGLWFHQSTIPPEIDAADVAVLLDSWARFPFYSVGRHARREGPGMPDVTRIDSGSVTLVWGGRDRLVPEWARRKWTAALPGASVVELPGFPHQPHLRDPARIADLVRERLS